MGAGFGIRQCVVMACKVISTGCCYSLQLMIWQAAAIMLTGCGQRVVETIIRIVHLVDAEHLFEATFIEAGVVRHQWEPLDHRRYLFPHIRENRRIFGVFRAKAVNLTAEPLIVFRLRMDEAVEAVHDDTATHDDHAHAANAGTLLVGGLEVYGGEVGHALNTGNLFPFCNIIGSKFLNPGDETSISYSSALPADFER